MAEDLGTIVVAPNRQRNPDIDLAKLLGQLIGKAGALTGNNIVKPIATEAIDTTIAPFKALGTFMSGIGEGATGNPVSVADSFSAQQKLKENNATLAKKKASIAETNGDPMADPEAYTQKVILAAVTPMIAQHAAEAYSQTGQVPSAKEVLGVVNFLANGASPQAQSQAQEQTQMSQTNIKMPSSPFTRQGYDQATNTVQMGGLFDFGGPTLDNIAKAQRITGKEPLQARQVGEAALEVTKAKKIAEEVPLTQAQQAELQAGYSKQMTEQRDKAMTRLDDTIKQLQEYRQQVWDKSNFLGKGKKIKDIDEQLKKLQEFRAYHMQENFDRDVGTSTPKKSKAAEKYSEADIQHTLKLHPEYTREQLLAELGK